ncbi:hypothetical protein AAKU64_004666, partial [Undibacterium sp. GrIS 1.8]|uniref:hypothetical protein n=1 Tax=Undibacterium sp. GrIS 1.8 TaxID=3143934 RepID=UPI003392DCC9
MSGAVLKLSDPKGSDPKGNSALGNLSDSKIAQGLQLSEDQKRIKELEKNIADLEKLNAEKDKQASANKKTAPGKTRHVAHAKGWNAICTEPDLCKVGKDIIAFDSFATLDNQHQASP